MSKDIIQKVVVAGVVKSENGVLLLQRHRNETTFPGLWELPSGKKEPLEDVETALYREIEEEAGIKGEIIRPLSVFSYTVEKDTEIRDSTQINYLVRPTTQEVVLSDEHENYAWVGAGEVGKYDMTIETREVVEKALNLSGSDSKNPIDWNVVYSSGKKFRQLEPVDVRTIFGRFPTGAKVIDLGCGIGELAYQLAKLGFEVTGIDPSAVAIEQAKKLCPQASFLCSSVEDYQFSQFDVGILDKSLSFMKDKMAVLKNLKKYCETIILITPTLDSLEGASVREQSISFVAKELSQLLGECFREKELLLKIENRPGYSICVYLLTDDPK